MQLMTFRAAAAKIATEYLGEIGIKLKKGERRVASLVIRKRTMRALRMRRRSTCTKEESNRKQRG
jgi:hypothetical protein